MSSLIKKYGIYFLFFIIFASLIAFSFFIVNYITHGETLSSIMLNAKAQLNDFFMHFGYASSPWGTNIYEYSTNACFPPLAYVFYGLLARLVGYEVKSMSPYSHLFIENNLTIYTLYSAVCIVLLIYAVGLYLKKDSFITKVWFPIILILSYPFIFTSMQRGNSVLLVSILLCIALVWKDDESKIKQELSLILIAICAGFKIYPALIGIIFLKEKRFTQSIRLIIYGVIFFFVPFMFWGGLDALKSFFNTILFLSGEVHDCSIRGIINYISRALFQHQIDAISIIVQQLFLITMLTSFFFTKKKYLEVLFLSSIMTLYVSSSYMYTCVYLLIPLLTFFKESNDNIHVDFIGVILTILFIITFSIFFIIDYVILYIIIALLVSILGIYTLIEFFKDNKDLISNKFKTFFSKFSKS